MPQVTISWNPDDLFAEMTDLAQEQVPFALSQAINDAAKVFQGAERNVITGNFEIRRPWVLQGVYIPRFSNKHDNPMDVTIMIKEDRDFMNKFEPGGTKTARSGGNLAIPIGARASKRAIVPDNLRPKRLNFTQTTSKSGTTQWKGQLRTFIVTLADGRQAILQRTGPKRTDVQLLFVLRPSAAIPAILDFQETARGTVIDTLVQQFPIRFNAAALSARPR